ncbi:MAG: NAD(P)H-dependent oxidoreductase subunit E [FCB group bacterium]|nr:NAD(P)H-dependent oxidoreductase subunit E [FCB group bacterium]
MVSDSISSILEKHKDGHGSIISILEEIQATHSYLPQEVLEAVAEKTGRSLVDIYGVATFYGAFSLQPRGKHLVSACLGTACHVRGGPAVVAEIEKQLGIKAGETTPDREYTLDAVNCLGACALGPVMVIDGHYFPKVDISKVKGILEQAKEGLDKIEVETDQRIFPVEVSCSHCNHSLMDPEFILDRHPGIRVTISFGNKHGWLVLSSLYGSYRVQSLHKIPDDTIVNVFCPHCHAELIGGAKCLECGASMVPMIVRGGGVVQICSRRGCKGHMLDLSGVSVA